MVVNQDYDIVHLSENAGRYLHFAAGEPSANLIKVHNPALQLELRTALFRASQAKEPVDGAPTTVEFDGTRREVITVNVRPIQAEDMEQGFYLDLFMKESGRPSQPAAPPFAHDALTRNLESEIESLKRQLSDSHEQYEAANEELKASNEELQAMNEEMRSATEELETSKEELQSVNEELITVNTQLKSSVEELSRDQRRPHQPDVLDRHRHHLSRSAIAGATFHPERTESFQRHPGRRRATDLRHHAQARYTGLSSKTPRRFWKTWCAIEREVRLVEEHWFLVRIAPYRTAEDRIAGVVAHLYRHHHGANTPKRNCARVKNGCAAPWTSARPGSFISKPTARSRTQIIAFLEMTGYSRAEVERGRLSWQKITPEEFMPRLPRSDGRVPATRARPRLTRSNTSAKMARVFGRSSPPRGWIKIQASSSSSISVNRSGPRKRYANRRSASGSLPSSPPTFSGFSTPARCGSNT